MSHQVLWIALFIRWAPVDGGFFFLPIWSRAYMYRYICSLWNPMDFFFTWSIWNDLWRFSTAMSENSRNMCPKYHVFFRREVMKWRRSLAWELEGVAIPSIEKLPLGLVVGIMATNIFHTPFEKTQSHESPPKKQQQKKHCSQKPNIIFDGNRTSPVPCVWIGLQPC